MHKNKIYVYYDKGVAEPGISYVLASLNEFLGKQYSIQTLNAKEVIEKPWMEDAVLWVMPGGSDLYYLRKLKGLGNQRIQAYVAQGGAYLGLCAGAYYAAAYVEFDKEGPLEVLGARELKFFPGKAIGPILAPYDYESKSGSRAAQLRLNLEAVKTTSVYYNGGCYFEGTEQSENTRVLAYYANGLPAIIECAYQKGRAILSGVHFEYDPNLVDAEDPYHQAILSELKESNDSRIAVLKRLLQRLGLKV